MQDSIFTKIIQGEIPCHKVYEDEHTFAFMDIHPVQPGHVLVITKKQVDHIWDLSDEDYSRLMATVKKVGSRLREVLTPKRVGVQIIGLDVPHVHVHVFPFNTPEEFRSVPDTSEDPDHEALAEMAKRLSI